MALSKNRIKYINSLKLKKIRESEGQFVIEGDKIISDLLNNNDIVFSQLIATEAWLLKNRELVGKKAADISEAGEDEMARISSFETPPPVLALMEIPKIIINYELLANELSIGLECIQDPGNLGTILRTADWFGIRNILCSSDSADCFNPKVIQASMGALINVNVHYVNLAEALKELGKLPGYDITGTFLNGTDIYSMAPVSAGILIFGNEARGISKDLDPYISRRITIPSPNKNRSRVESLNVASAVAIACSVTVKK